MGLKAIVKGGIGGGNFTPWWMGKDNFKTVKDAVLANANGKVGIDFHMFSTTTLDPLGLFVQDHQILWEVTGQDWPTIIYFWDAISGAINLEFSTESTARSLALSDPSQVYVYWNMTCGPVIMKNGQQQDWSKPSVDPTVKKCRVAIGFKTGDTGTLYFMYHSNADFNDLMNYANQFGINNLINGDGGGSAQIYFEPTNEDYHHCQDPARTMPNAPQFNSYTIVDKTII